MDLIVYAARCGPGADHDTAHWLLKRALEQELKVPMLPPIARGPCGKPYFPDRPDICFNLSHSHGAAVCAVHDKPVGIDAEKLRPAPKRISAGMEAEAFFRLWTAKEATIKRDGAGIARLLRPFTPDPLCRALDGVLDGYIITVCPSEDAPIKAVYVEKTPAP